MSAIVLDGNKIGAQIRAEVASEVKTLTAAGMRPGLAVILVGHNPASEIYVRGKVKSSEEVGIYSEKHTPPDTVSTQALIDLVVDLNRRDEIDGILVQLPLPPQVDAKKVLMTVDPAKDVDGFHPVNVGFLSTQRPGLVPCTPAGVMEMLERSKIKIAGQEAVVVGRSDIVGKPMAMLLLNANASDLIPLRRWPSGPETACGWPTPRCTSSRPPSNRCASSATRPAAATPRRRGRGSPSPTGSAARAATARPRST